MPDTGLKHLYSIQYHCSSHNGIYNIVDNDLGFNNLLYIDFKG